MSLKRTFTFILVALLAGLTGFIFARTLEGNRESILHSFLQPLALPESNIHPLPLGQSDTRGDTLTQAPSQPPAPSEVIPNGSPGEPKMLVTVADNLLSIQVQNRSLVSILEQISDQTGIPIIISEGVKDKTVSFQFQNLPLDQGLQVLLKELDAFFFYGAQGHSPASLSTVWLYPKGKGRRIVPVPPDAYAGTAEMQQNLSDPDPDERARAVEALIKLQGSRALNTVLQVLKDPDEKVRYRALHQAVRLDVSLPEEFMQRLVLSDPSPVVRFLALEALVNVPGANPATIHKIAELALNDPNETIHEQALDILAKSKRSR